MSSYLQKLFKGDNMTLEEVTQKQGDKMSFKKLLHQINHKPLPKDFAQRILNYDITLVMTNFTNGDALNGLVQLYMQGVEFYEITNDKRKEYFKTKLQWLMNPPNVLTHKIETEKNSLSSLGLIKDYNKNNVKVIQQVEIQKNATKQSFPPGSLIQDATSLQQFGKTNHLNKKESLQHEALATIITEPDENSQQDDKINCMRQQMRQEIFIQDDNKQVKKMLANLKEETNKIQSIIQEDLETQSKSITNRLRKRSFQTSRTMLRASSQPSTEIVVSFQNVEIKQEENLSSSPSFTNKRSISQSKKLSAVMEDEQLPVSIFPPKRPSIRQQNQQVDSLN